MPGRRENTDELDPAGLEPVDPPGMPPVVKAPAVRPLANHSSSHADARPDGESPEPEAGPRDGEPVDYSDDNILIDAHEDRWHWRRKIRANPHQLRIYRVIVAIGGLLFVALGLVTGPLPGPGGIPLILLGIAIWSSEFEWAHRLMHFFKAQLKRFQSWSRWQQAGFWLAFFSFCGLCGYSFMLATGVPGWMPEPANNVLERLPGL